MVDRDKKEILEAIEASRVKNTEEHKLILANAKESAELAQQIESIINKWTTFWGVIMTLRNITFTAGFVVAMAFFITNWVDVINKVGQ